MEVRRASAPCSRSRCCPPPARPPECMRSANRPTWPTAKPRRRMLSEFFAAWSHGRAPTEHDSADTARDNIERHKECEEEDTRDRTDVGDRDGDDADPGPDISRFSQPFLPRRLTPPKTSSTKPGRAFSKIPRGLPLGSLKT